MTNKTRHVSIREEITLIYLFQRFQHIDQALIQFNRFWE